MKISTTCFAVLIMAVLFTLSINSYIDYNFKSVQYRVEQSIYICEQLNSKPYSLDEYSVTCESGQTVQFLERDK